MRNKLFLLSYVVLSCLQSSDNIIVGSSFLISHTVKELSNVASSDRGKLHSNSIRDDDGREYLVTGKSVDKDTVVLVVTVLGKNAATDDVDEFRKQLADFGHKGAYENQMNEFKHVDSEVKSVVLAHYKSRSKLLTKQLVIE